MAVDSGRVVYWQQEVLSLQAKNGQETIISCPDCHFVIQKSATDQHHRGGLPPQEVVKKAASAMQNWQKWTKDQITFGAEWTLNLPYEGGLKMTLSGSMASNGAMVVTVFHTDLPRATYTHDRNAVMNAWMESKLNATPYNLEELKARGQRMLEGEDI
mmetsp:Transcript_49147/g.77708  ORF Transcript_49147/g.77708 Transcript_49147/m.77708 type:complete len:158 (-) Transcript_49147:132-605(-)